MAWAVRSKMMGSSPRATASGGKVDLEGVVSNKVLGGSKTVVESDFPSFVGRALKRQSVEPQAERRTALAATKAKMPADLWPIQR